MKRDLVRLLAGILAITGLFSCAGYQGGPSPSAADNGIRSGDHATTRAEIDEILNSAPPKQRPGLATGWGHQKDSAIYSRGFARSSSKPAGTDAIYYNDGEGVKAMAGRRERVAPMQTAAGGLVEWGIKGRSGYLPSYKEGYSGFLANSSFGRRLVVGEKNSNYTIVVRNRSKSTLEIVASVDGLDVMDGKTASFAKRGYLVDPGKTLEIDGFRTSHSSVAAFRFSGVSDSYANLRHGNTKNVGVIGLAVFTQKGVDPWTWMPAEVEVRDRAQPFAEAP